jgi:hypothetical protein
VGRAPEQVLEYIHGQVDDTLRSLSAFETADDASVTV